MFMRHFWQYLCFYRISDKSDNLHHEPISVEKYLPKGRDNTTEWFSQAIYLYLIANSLPERTLLSKTSHLKVVFKENKR